MRLNRYIATYSGVSRRKADELIVNGSVVVNRKLAHVGMEVSHDDIVIVAGKRLIPVQRTRSVVALHKPVGYVCSKDGQGSPSVYDLLPRSMGNLHIAGRLDKDSSGLVILTDDGLLLQEITHPSNNKIKRYNVTLKYALTRHATKQCAEGVNIGDTRLSKLLVTPIKDRPRGKNLHDDGFTYEVTVQEGRNRQIRRTFEALGNHVIDLHRTHLGDYELGRLKSGAFIEL